MGGLSKSFNAMFTQVPLQDSPPTGEETSTNAAAQSNEGPHQRDLKHTWGAIHGDPKESSHDDKTSKKNSMNGAVTGAVSCGILVLTPDLAVKNLSSGSARVLGLSVSGLKSGRGTQQPCTMWPSTLLT